MDTEPAFSQSQAKRKDAQLSETSALRDLHRDIPDLFTILKKAFGVKNQIVLDVSSVEVLPEILKDATELAGITLRKLQALYYATRPGQVTKVEILVGLVAEIDRATADLAVLIDDRQVQLALRQFPAKAFTALKPFYNPRVPRDPDEPIRI